MFRRNIEPGVKLVPSVFFPGTFTTAAAKGRRIGSRTRGVLVFLDKRALSPFCSQIDIPNPLYLFKLERDRRTDPQNPTHRSPTIGKLLQPTAHLPVSHHFTSLHTIMIYVPSYEAGQPGPVPKLSLSAIASTDHRFSPGKKSRGVRRALPTRLAGVTGPAAAVPSVGGHERGV